MADLSTEPTHATLTLKLSPKDAHDLLERLATDDEFRERMRDNAVSAFAEYGVHIDGHFAKEKVELPDKDSIRQAIDHRLAREPFVVGPFGEYNPSHNPFIFLLALVALL